MELVLQMPDLHRLFEIEANALKWTTGAVLKQKDKNGKWHPCGYILHLFTPAE
jgi:hypothetical protein